MQWIGEDLGQGVSQSLNSRDAALSTTSMSQATPRRDGSENEIQTNTKKIPPEDFLLASTTVPVVDAQLGVMDVLMHFFAQHFIP